MSGKPVAVAAVYTAPVKSVLRVSAAVTPAEHARVGTAILPALQP